MSGRTHGRAAESTGNQRTYGRTAGTRAVGAGCFLLFGGGALSYALTSGATPLFVVLAGLSALSLANLVTAFADRYTLDESGIEYRNVVLSRLGQRPRRVGWDEIVRVREHRRLRAGDPETRPSAIFLTLRSGRRMVLDSIENLEEILLTVRRRCGTAVGEGGTAEAQ